MIDTREQGYTLHSQSVHYAVGDRAMAPEDAGEEVGGQKLFSEMLERMKLYRTAGLQC